VKPILLDSTDRDHVLAVGLVAAAIYALGVVSVLLFVWVVDTIARHG